MKRLPQIFPPAPAEGSIKNYIAYYLLRKQVTGRDVPNWMKNGSRPI